MDITSWVDWCAVLGFGLSLALAIAELLRRRKRLAVSLAKAVFADEGDRLWCNLFLTITNQSSVAISINTVYLLTDENQKLTADDSNVPVFSQSIKSKGVNGEYSNLSAYSDRASTKFPIFLQPYESRAILLSYVVSQKTRRALRLPSARNRRRPAHNARWGCHTLLATSRGAVHLDISARIVSLDSMFEMLDEECKANAERGDASVHSSDS